MSITTELREWWQHRFPVMDEKLYRDFVAIADRIDIAHKHAIGYVADYDSETMAENGWVKLPKDVHGEYIHVGDVVYDCNESPKEKFSVATMELCKWGWALIDNYGERNEPGQCRHYHAPTVEDVLREFVERWHDTHHDDIPALFAEYAAKLRLAGDAE